MKREQAELLTVELSELVERRRQLIQEASTIGKRVEELTETLRPWREAQHLAALKKRTHAFVAKNYIGVAGWPTYGDEVKITGFGQRQGKPAVYFAWKGKPFWVRPFALSTTKPDSIEANRTFNQIVARAGLL